MTLANDQVSAVHNESVCVQNTDSEVTYIALESQFLYRQYMYANIFLDIVNS